MAINKDYLTGKIQLLFILTYSLNYFIYTKNAKNVKKKWKNSFDNVFYNKYDECV